MIKFNSVSFSYGEKKILSEFSMHIAEKERVCLFGSSGAGKTTILRLIMGLEKPAAGSVTVRSRSISAVFQEDRLLPFKTVLQNTELFAPEIRAAELLSILGLGEAVNMYPSELSGGMARRVALARALAAESDIYILDEPFDGLDKNNADAAAAVINENTSGKTLVLVSHDPAEAESLGCRIIEI